MRQSLVYCHWTINLFLKLCILESILFCDAILEIPTVLLPTKRISLADCPVRYYKYFEKEVKTPVVFGEPTVLTEFSHMAAIGWTQPDKKIDWKCGGSLITQNTVLTAAHCIALRTVPDKVRLGDINIYSADDNQNAQQFSIASIIVHPKHKISSRYFDIALVQLKDNVVLHETVAPACLWREENIVSDELAAIGWGQTQDSKTSEVLMKVKLRTITNTECANYYEPSLRLKLGIQPSQLCAGDVKMDTCYGDSGGPLEMKLLGSGHMTPFIVGITSFGKGCGSLSPGVYTRVSSFVDWIESTLNTTFDPIECTLKYKHYREYEPNVISKRFSNFIEIDESLRFIKNDDFFTKHNIQIGWSNVDERNQGNSELDLNEKYENVQWECGGVLISENYVLSSAQCLRKRGDVKPDNVKSEDLQYIKIDKIINHPEFNPTFYYHDLALVRLINDIRISFDSARPTCLWRSANFTMKKLQMSAYGPTNINVFAENYLSTELDHVKTPAHLKVTINATENTKCNLEFQKTQQLVYGINNKNQICLKNNQPIVPGACQLNSGGSVQQQLRFYGRIINYVFAINSFGENCGFRTPVVATKVHSYLDWIDSVVLGEAITDARSKLSDLRFSSYIDWAKARLQVSSSTNVPGNRIPLNSTNDGGLVFSNDDSEVGDSCAAHNEQGICVYANNCKINEQKLSICSTHPHIILCCPKHLVRNATTLGQPENSGSVSKNLGTIVGCAHRYKEHRVKKVPNLALEMTSRAVDNNELAHVGEFYGKLDPTDSCYVTLITDQYVITSVKCAKNYQQKTLWLGWGDSAQYFNISQTFVHPDYEETTNSHDLVLMKMDGPAVLSSTVLPACIWFETELMPYELQQVVYQESYKIFAQHYAYNVDCQKDYDQFNQGKKIRLNDNIMCTEDNVCPTLGVSIQKMMSIDNHQIPFVFGVYFQKRNCLSTDVRLPYLYTRLAPYVDWIEKIVDS